MKEKKEEVNIFKGRIQISWIFRGHFQWIDDNKKRVMIVISGKLADVLYKIFNLRNDVD